MSSSIEYIKLEDLANESPKPASVIESERPGGSNETKGVGDLPTAGLGKWTFTRWIVLLCNIVFLLVPLIFIIIAAIATTLHDKQTSPFGASIQQAIFLLPTLFPIIFAAIMGKFFRTLALYRAERGVLLGSLERIVGCQSLFGAIERQIALRKMDVFGVLIAVVWALSPVGGQSALRLLSTTPRPTDMPIYYLPIEAASGTFLADQDSSVNGFPSFGAIYLSALRSSRNQQSSSTDLWGNIKIPDIDSLSIATSPSDQDGWLQIDQTTASNYSSLLGIPVIDVPTIGNSTFTITSRYFAIECEGIEYIKNYTDWNGPYATTQGSFKMSMNGFVQNTTNYDPSASIMSFLVYSLAEVDAITSVTRANMSLGIRDVSSKIRCQDQSCRVEAMRHSTVPVEERPMFEAKQQINLLNNLPQADIFSTTAIPVTGSQSTDQWLCNPETDFTILFQFVNLAKLDPQTFGKRFQVVYNTFWQATYGAQSLVGNLKQNLTAASTEISMAFNTTQAHVLQSERQMYVCHWTYVALLIITSLVLLAAGLATLILKHMTLAPDIFGYASSCIRDNPYAMLGPDADGGASHKDGLEQARVLRRVRVMIGDVNGESEVGHIAFATMRAEPQRLRKHRQYD